MNDIALRSDTQDIVVDTDFPHAPETIWRMLTTSELIGRWMMVPTGFEPVAGKRFTFQTTPAGAWDGVIHCQVLEVIPNARLVHSWKAGHDGNAGYGSRLDTVITWTLAATETGTRLRLVHSGFVPARNGSALATLGEGWKKVAANIGAIADEQGEEEETGEPWTGGCACGAIRYEIAAEPVFMNDCQCRDCQLRSGTGHGSYLTFLSAGVKRLQGEATRWSIVADNGNVKSHAFCSACGSPVYLTSAAKPDFFTVHAASLDDPSRFKPQVVTYRIRGHAWDRIDQNLPQFEKMPPM